MELKNPSDNLHIYRQVSSVPEDAQKPFESSWGKTLTEINGMWRIQKLTELFGPCGEGWFTEVTRQERVDFPNGEVCVFTDINLYLKDTKTGRWSKPIRGTGGNRLVLKNADGLFIDDEAYKKAYTDALGIAVDAQVGVRVDGEMLHLDTVAPEVRLKGHRPHDGEIAHTGVAVHVVGDLAVGELAGDLLVAHDVVLPDAVLALKLLPRYPVQSLLDELRVSDLLLLGVLVLLCFHMKII